MSKLMLWSVLSAGVVEGLASPASRASFPTLSGPTGLVKTPTADLAPAGESQLALLYDDQEEGEYRSEYEGEALSVLHLLRGGPRFEIGAGFDLLALNPDNDEVGYFLHGKVRLRDPTPRTPALAVGAVFANTSGLGRSQTLYVAASQPLTRPPVGGGAVYGHLMFGWERAHPDGGESQSDLVGGIGLEYRHPLRQREWSVFLDYQFQNDLVRDDHLALGARMEFGRGMTGEIGIGDGQEFFLGVTSPRERRK